jgi:hypothetical integral membrane protein (TIGR02206 family)
VADGFERYGPPHATVLAATAATTLILAILVRRPSEPLRRSIRVGLSLVLIASTALFFVRAMREGSLRWWDVAPLQLCDLAVFVTVYALLTLRPWACELAYFWGCSGTLIAMITPDLVAPFPSWEFVFFFLLHGAVVTSAIVLTFGFGVRPRRWAALRVLAATNVYALAVGTVDVLTGSNFMYLRAKPAAGSLLDSMGPWPVYIFVADALAFVLFWGLETPFRHDRLSKPPYSSSW